MTSEKETYRFIDIDGMIVDLILKGPPFYTRGHFGIRPVSTGELAIFQSVVSVHHVTPDGLVELDEKWAAQ